MADENNKPELIGVPDLDNFQGLGGAAGIDPVDPNEVGMNSKSPAMRLIEQRKQQSAQQGIPNSALPAPTTLPTGQIAYPPAPAVDGISKTPIPTANDLAKNFITNLNNSNISAGAAVDPFKFSKNIDVDTRNPLYSNQYVDRYEAHDDFQQLGFSPFRDNETLYNANSSWWDEMSRASSQWWSMTKLGFADAMSFGDTTDSSAAKSMQRSMAIGSSSKGGVGGFTTNLFLNSGYTVGILGELAMEELVMLGGQALAGATAWGHGGTANVAVGAAMVGRATRAGSKIRKGWKMATNMSKTLGSLKDINVARKLWSSTKNGARGIGKFLNPLENTMDYAQNFKKLDGLSNFAKTSRGFGAMYRDIRNARLAFGEGSLEGGMVENDMQNKLYDQFVKENGRGPTTAEGHQLKLQAKQAGVTTTLINAPMIMLSNKLTFDGLVRGRMGRLRSNFIDAGLGRKIVMNPKAELGKVFSVAPAKWRVKARAKMYYQNPRLLAKGVTTYAKANWAEGLQELGQETIAGASTDYYLNKYSGDAVRGGHMSYMAGVAKNLGGHAPLETFMSGFLMGGMIAPVSNTIAATTGQSPTLNNLYLKFANKEKYNKIKGERDTQLNETVKQLNELYEDPAKYFSPDLENVQEQKRFQEDMDIADQNNDARQYYDLKNASATKHITTALRMGRLDTFIQRMAELKGHTAEEIQQEYGMGKQEFDQQMDNGIKQAERIQQRWDTAQKKYSNPFDASKFKEGTAEYKQESMRQNAWDKAIEQMVTMQDSFDNALKRKTEILSGLHKTAGLEKTGASEFTPLESIQSLESEISSLKTEIENIDTLEEVSDPQLKHIAEYKKKKIAALEKYRDAVQKNIYEKKDDNEELSSEEYDEVADAFKEYTKLVAGESGDYVHNDSLEDAARSSTDAHFLGVRAKKVNAAVNVLLDPKGFVNQVERFEALSKIIHGQKEQEIRKSLEEFLKLKDTNDMLGELAEQLENAGMFVDPKALIELIKTGKVPKEIYYIKGKEGGESLVDSGVPYTSTDYAKAIEIFKNFAEHLHGITIGQQVIDPYGLNVHREKLEGDTRTYEDLAKQYGFDPATASTAVPLVQVLETIALSEHATDQEKALAEKLLEIADRRETVTFVNTGRSPGKYSKQEQSVVDARYSAKDYDTGEGPAIETTILKQEIVRRTQDSLENNKEFEKEIQTLREEASKHYADLTADDRARLFGSETKTKIPMGLMSNEQFVEAAMNDPKFQEMLAMVDTDMTTEDINPTWKKFVDSVLEVISKLLGKNIGGTVLNATMNVITANIDANITKTSRSKKSTKGRTKSSVRRGSQLTPGELMAIDGGKLGDLVLEEFKNENKKRVEDGNNPLLIGYEVMNDTDILNSTAFKNYLNDPNFTKKERIIRNYKAEDELSAVEKAIQMDKEIEKAITIKGVKAKFGEFRTEEKPTNTKSHVVVINGKRYRIMTELYENGEGVYRISEVDNKGIPVKDLTEQEFNKIKNEEATTRSTLETEVEPIIVGEVNLDDITTEEYAKWIDKGVDGIHTNSIYKLAQKVKNRSMLTTQEQAMLGDSATMAKINEMLQDMAQPTPKIVSSTMKKQLRALGYTRSVIKKMSPARAKDYILRGLSAEDRKNAGKKPSFEQSIQAEILEFNNTIDEVFAEIDNFDKLITIKDGKKIPTFKNNIRALYNQLSTEAKVKLGDTETLMQRIDSMETQKLEELAFTNKFEDFNTGQHIILNNKYETTGRITKITKDSLTYEYSKKNKDELEVVEVTIKAEDVPTKIKYRFTPALQELESRDSLEEPIDQEAKDQATESKENLGEIDNTTDIQDDIDQAKNDDSQKRDEDFLDNIC